jgi:hypothetical protein
MLSQKLPLELMQTQWAQELNPIIRNQLLQGILLQNITIKSGVNVINHKLGRKQIGYIIADIDSPAVIYRSQPLNALTLTLTSDANANISVWVF